MIRKNIGNNKKFWDLFPFMAAISIFAAMFFLGIYRCPLSFLFGIPCPLCGATRAAMALVHGDFAEAFYYHPLWPVLLLAVILFMLNTLKVIKPSQRTKDAAVCVLCILLLVCYVIRHIQGSPVVRISFKDSFLYEVWEHLHS